jgi:hypothetical protein
MTMPGNHHKTWLRQFDSRPAATTRLACFPHAGGSATGLPEEAPPTIIHASFMNEC